VLRRLVVNADDLGKPFIASCLLGRVSLREVEQELSVQIDRSHTGVLSAHALAAMLRGLPPGVTELMVHPGYVDERLERLNTRLLDARTDEVELLTNPNTFDLLITQRIALIRHDLAVREPRSLRHAS
jgi:predicted glycoside hydrolase/deacetylase ChbG (UPF0249 family)